MLLWPHHVPFNHRADRWPGNEAKPKAVARDWYEYVVCVLFNTDNNSSIFSTTSLLNNVSSYCLHTKTYFSVCMCASDSVLTLSWAGSPGGAPWSCYMRGQVPGVLRSHTMRWGNTPGHCPRERGRRGGGRWPGRWSSQWSEVVPGGGHRCTQSAPADTYNSKVLYHWPFHGSCETNHCVCMLTITAAGCLSEHTGEWEELTMIRHLAVVIYGSMVCMSVSHIHQCAQRSILLLSSIDQWFVFLFITFTSVFR